MWGAAQSNEEALVNDLEYQVKRSWSLVIDRFHSTCGACGQPAFPDEKSHERMAGLGNGKKYGCGAIWKYSTTNYHDDRLNEAIKKMRPDLEFWV